MRDTIEVLMGTMLDMLVVVTVEPWLLLVVSVTGVELPCAAITGVALDDGVEEGPLARLIAWDGDETAAILLPHWAVTVEMTVVVDIEQADGAAVTVTVAVGPHTEPDPEVTIAVTVKVLVTVVVTVPDVPEGAFDELDELAALFCGL